MARDDDSPLPPEVKAARRRIDQQLSRAYGVKEEVLPSRDDRTLARERRGESNAHRIPAGVIDIQRLASVWSEDALNALAEIVLKSKDDKARIAAAKEILDRAHGKVPVVQYTDPNDGNSDAGQQIAAAERELEQIMGGLLGEDFQLGEGQAPEDEADADELEDELAELLEADGDDPTAIDVE